MTYRKSRNILILDVRPTWNKNQKSDVVMQIYALNQFSARQNKAIAALLKLQAFGITDDELGQRHSLAQQMNVLASI
jgi:hypothetical protein